MSEGWGRDFDEDGNIIGEVPDDDTEKSTLERHKYKVAALATIWFILGAARAPELTAGYFVGGAIVSVAIACALVLVGAWLHSKLN